MKVKYQGKIIERIDSNDIPFTEADSRKIALKINNPKGNNRYTDKKELIKSQPKPLTEIEEFDLLPENKQRDVISMLGNELWKKKKEVLPLARRFTALKNYYEAKHFGWKWEE